MKYTTEYLIHLAGVRLEQEGSFPFRSAYHEGIALIEKSIDILRKLEQADRNEQNNLKKLTTV